MSLVWVIVFAVFIDGGPRFTVYTGGDAGPKEYATKEQCRSEASKALGTARDAYPEAEFFGITCREVPTQKEGI